MIDKLMTLLSVAGILVTTITLLATAKPKASAVSLPIWILIWLRGLTGRHSSLVESSTRQAGSRPG
jgi:hypothetical protein